MKGQMFIIAAIFIIIGLILVHNLLNVFDLFEETRKTTSLVGDRNIDNIAKEYEYIAGIASMNNANVSAISMLSNFSDLIREVENAKIFYALVFVNGSSNDYSITIGNYAGNGANTTIDATGSSPPSVNLLVGDRANKTAFFSSSAGIREINITYTIRNETIMENFSVNITGRNTIQIFYDISLRNNDLIKRTKSLYNTTWS